MEKMTKRDYFNALRTLADASDRSDLVEFIDHELALLAKKNSARSTKPTKTQVANAGYMENILSAMETGKAYTVSELVETVPELKGFSVNKVSALVRGLKLDGRVIRSEVKGKAYFTKAE